MAGVWGSLFVLDKNIILAHTETVSAHLKGVFRRHTGRQASMSAASLRGRNPLICR